MVVFFLVLSQPSILLSQQALSPKTRQRHLSHLYDLPLTPVAAVFELREKEGKDDHPGSWFLVPGVTFLLHHSSPVDWSFEDNAWGSSQ